MKRLILSCLLGLTLMTNASFASEQGTPEEAKAMVEAAIEMIEAEGEEATIAEINDPNSTKFIDRDLYVFIISTDDKGTFLAHGVKPQLVGKDLIALKDVKGTPLVKNFIDKVKADGEGWVDYYWPHPITKKTTSKSSFVKGYGDKFLVGVGVYKK